MFFRRYLPKSLSVIGRNYSSTNQATKQTIVVDNVAQQKQANQEAKAAADESLQAVNEYKDALNYFRDGKYRISDELFKRVLNILEQNQQGGSENHRHILKK